MSDDKTNQASIEQHDHLVHWRCPQLGGEVPFRYCRKVAGGLPCPRIVGCWKTVFDIEAFLERHYDLDELEALWNRPRPDKIVQLAEFVARAPKKPAAEGGGGRQSRDGRESKSDGGQG